jgi:hypothetical protein
MSQYKAYVVMDVRCNYPWWGRGLCDQNPEHRQTASADKKLQPFLDKVFMAVLHPQKICG